MVISQVQKHAIEETITVLLNASSPRAKRKLVGMFLVLPDRESWPEYYQVIPEPRCIHGIQADLKGNKYKDPLDVFTDLQLVFLNALYYNEDGSQIAKDAAALKVILENEWKQRSVLPIPRTSPPPVSAQRVYAAPQQASGSGSKAEQTQPHPTPLAAASSPAPQPDSSAYGDKSPERQQSPDVDIDVGGTPEPEGLPTDTARDEESEEIVKQLEKGLPRWDGFADVGWMEEVDPGRYLAIVLAIKNHEDQNGTRLAASLEAVPEEATIPEFPYNVPLSLSLIENRSREKYYQSSKAFDKETSQFFLKARRWYEQCSEAYGNVLVLQRLYHALASSSPPPGPPYISPTNFASLRAGPGTAKPLHTHDTEGVHGVTTFRVSTKDRTFVDEVHFKGWTFRLADWVHMSNPDDPSRPIIGQVFKCFVSDEPGKKGRPGLTVCWYYRPEQTIHPADRQFWENEVFKTSHFADHPLEDVVEKIACQFTARHIRGRPRPPYWYPGWPLYVCDSRYNDRERIFVKIKNWNSCVPEEVRKSTEFMPIYPFERSVFPRRFPSPFLSGKIIKAPGGIGDVVERAEGEKIEGGGTGRKRPKRTAAATATAIRFEQTDRSGPSKGLYVGSTTAQPVASTSSYQYPPTAQTQYAQSGSTSLRGAGERSIVTAAGTNLGSNIVTEKLPSETAKHFDRDPETNEVLWFAAPPVDMVHSPAPRHSLAYLHFLAKKRKRRTPDNDAADITAGVPSSKRFKIQPTVTETLRTLIEKFGVDPSMSMSPLPGQ